jgi:hypothetical protein
MNSLAVLMNDTTMPMDVINLINDFVMISSNRVRAMKDEVMKDLYYLFALAKLLEEKDPFNPFVCQKNLSLHYTNVI